MNERTPSRLLAIAVLAAASYAASVVVGGIPTMTASPPASSSLLNALQELVPFPEWKGELLGGASHAALFGNDTENVVVTGSSPPSTFNPRRPPNVSPNTLVNGPQALFPLSLLGRSETTLTVSAEGNFLVAGWNDAEGFLRAPFTVPPILPGDPGLSGFGFSTDGGVTWTDGGTPFVLGVDPANPSCGNLVTRGDPWLDTGGNGNDIVYYANLAVHQDVTCFNAVGRNTAGVSVHRGHFTETSFGWDDVRLLQAVAGVGQSVGFPLDAYDKEALAADKRGSRPHAYVSVSNFVGRLPNIIGCGFGQIELWRSLDGGDTWISPPTLVQIDQVSAIPGLAGCFTGRLNQGSQPAVGPDGTVYVAWQNGPDFVSGSTVLPLDVDIMVANCGFSGAGPCVSTKVADINSVRLSAPQGYNRNRLQDFPRIAVAQTGRRAGRVYVVYASGTGTPVPAFPSTVPAAFPDLDVLLKFSDDGGATWEGPVHVNPPGDGRKDFWPVVSVDHTGNIDVVYVSSNETNLTPSLSDIECFPGAKEGGGGIAQNGRRSSLVDVFWDQSLDRGASFQAPVKVTEVSSNWCKARTNIRPTFGDYIDARSFGNRVFVAWADGRLPAPAADALAPPAGPRDRQSDAFYSTIRAIGRAPR